MTQLHRICREKINNFKFEKTKLKINYLSYKTTTIQSTWIYIEEHRMTK